MGYLYSCKLKIITARRQFRVLDLKSVFFNYLKTDFFLINNIYLEEFINMRLIAKPLMSL